MCKWERRWAPTSSLVSDISLLNDLRKVMGRPLTFTILLVDVVDVSVSPLLTRILTTYTTIISLSCGSGDKRMLNVWLARVWQQEHSHLPQIIPLLFLHQSQLLRGPFIVAFQSECITSKSQEYSDQSAASFSPENYFFPEEALIRINCPRKLYCVCLRARDVGCHA